MRHASVKRTGRRARRGDASKFRASLRAPVLSVASQGIGLLQLGALLLRFGPTNATDAYFYLFNLGNLPVQILIVGVLYPMLLNQDRITRKGARRFVLLVPLASIVVMAAGTGWLHLQGRLDAQILIIAGIAMLNALLQTQLWYRAVGAEAEGKPEWMAAIALPANALATAVVLLPWDSSETSIIAMYASLVLANGGLLLFMVYRKTGQRVLSSLPEIPARKHAAPYWFLAKSGVGYGGLVVLQSLALVLPPSTLTLLTLPVKIVGSVSSTFVNAVMPRLIHQETNSPAGARRFLRILLVILGGVGVLAVAVAAVAFPEYLLEVIVVALWLQAASAAAVAQRMMFKFLPPSASRITLVVVPVVVITVAFTIHLPNFGLVALLCSYALIDALTGFLILVALRDRSMAFTGAVVSILILGAALASLAV